MNNSTNYYIHPSHNFHSENRYCIFCHRTIRYIWAECTAESEEHRVARVLGAGPEVLGGLTDDRL
jgi:hypothetical protein